MRKSILRLSIRVNGEKMRKKKLPEPGGPFGYVLQYPVYTLNHRVLCEPGMPITEDFLAELAHSNQQGRLETYPLLNHGSLREDLLGLIRKPPYQIVFDQQQSFGDILDIMNDAHVIIPILQAVDYFKRHDYDTYRHVLMVFLLSTLLARDLVENFQDMIREAEAGPAHDLGKICVPLNVLKKTTPLTRNERHMVEHHTEAGYLLLCHYLQDVGALTARVARDHHERKDGSGYPHGIRIRDLMVEIVVVSDLYDALISPRPYRPVPYDNRAALEVVTAMAEEKKISWKVVQALVAHHRRNRPDYHGCRVSLEKRGVPPPGNQYGVFEDD